MEKVALILSSSIIGVWFLIGFILLAKESIKEKRRFKKVKARKKKTPHKTTEQAAKENGIEIREIR